MNKTELMMAFWPSINLREQWMSIDTCRSLWIDVIWVEIKCDDENKQVITLDHFSPNSKNALNTGLYVWASNYKNIVELKANWAHSASVLEMRQFSRWLTKYAAKIERAEIPQSFGPREKLILTLQAMGVRRGVKIDYGCSTPLEINSVEYYLNSTPAYAGPLAEMEALFKKEKV